MGAPLWRRVFWAPALWALAAESVFVSDDVPAQAVLRTRYQGVSVRVELAGVLRTATLRSDASATALTLEACAEQRVCATVANARLVRAAASAAAQAADPTGLGKLAWELEETRAEVGEAHAGAAHVGIFVIHLTDDAALDLLARSLRAAFPPPLEGGGLTQLTAPRLHVLCGPSPNTQGYDPSFWLERFQGRRALLGGVHLMTNANPFAPAAQRSHQGNYMAKACAMPRIAALQGYDHVVSSDDDVIVPAHAWRAFAWAAAAPRAGAPARLGAAGCTVATPLIHNAVPTGRSFAERALGGDAVRALDACFSSSSLGYVGKIHMDQIPQPISPWNESFWWDKLAGVEGVFKGGHPIRWNRRCMTLSLELALAHVGKWWDRDLDAAPAAGLEVHGPGAKPYPYFTNTLWMSTAKHYAAALDRYDLFVDRYDEVPLNLYTIQERHGALCTLPGAFVVHPAYNYVRDKSNRIQEAACRIDTHVADRDRRNSDVFPARTLSASQAAPKVAVVAVCGSPNQNAYFWPTYLALTAGAAHDLVVVHRGRADVLDANLEAARASRAQRVILVDKSTAGPGGGEVLARGFGAYRHAFQRFGDDYAIFCFLEDSVQIRRADWLGDALGIVTAHEQIGFAAAQVFNGNDAGAASTRYPHESHCRAPGPLLVKATWLKRLDWDGGFSSDHAGEMWFCKALAGLGAVGVQAGNKVNLAYDNVGVPPLAAGAERRTNYRHTTTLLETHYFPEKNGTVPFAQSEFNFFEELWATLPTIQKRRGEAVASPFKHIGVQRTFEDLQPFNNLIFAGSLAAAQRTFGDRVVKRDSNVYTLDLEAVVPADRVGEAQHSDASPQCGDWACVVACVAGRHALEIGGPTLLFVKRNFEVYPHLASAHNLNLYSLADSFQTIKASPLNKVFSERFSALADVGREYELLMTSHAIEHFANPLRLLSDFAAKLVPHGLILSFVPNHVEFWDKTRPLTTFDHLLADFANDMQEDDLTHIDENLATDHPYKRNPHHPDIAPGLTYANMLWANIEYRTMHHHTFDIDLVVQMHEHLGFETIAAFTPANDKLQLIYLGRRKW